MSSIAVPRNRARLPWRNTTHVLVASRRGNMHPLIDQGKPEGEQHMGKVIAAITTSVDGYITGPHDGPGNGLGDGGERLHYWVFGGPWTYDDAHSNGPDGEDAAYLDEM